jgi:hypothetical protein
MIERIVPNKYGEFVFRLDDDGVSIYMNDKFLGQTDYIDIDTASDFELLCIVNDILEKYDDEY